MSIIECAVWHFIGIFCGESSRSEVLEEFRYSAHAGVANAPVAWQDFLGETACS